MDIQGISNKIYDLKEKISDAEYKDLMDLLKLHHEEHTDREWYNFTYISTKNIVYHNGDQIGYKLETKKKCKKVYVKSANYNMVKFFLNHIEKIGNDSDNDFQFRINKVDNEFELELGTMKNNYKSVWFQNPYRTPDRDTEGDGSREEMENEYGVWLNYKSVIPISLKKY